MQLLALMLCVNGAAAGWPRKAFWTTVGASEGDKRQWGRGRMAAEGVRTSQDLYAALERQWGRGRMAAEGARHVRNARAVRAASMGPRPDGRGRLTLLGREEARKEQERQWGRGRMAAEGRM